MLAADALHVGAVYIEQDLGSDLHGDLFEITFVGGVDGTHLTSVTINGDKNGAGFSLADVIFDSQTGGLGADEGFALEVVSNDGVDVFRWHVDDGTSQLILEFEGFDAGDKIVFSIDVDEVQEYEFGMTDDEINEGLDPITSGIEFQGSLLIAEFSAQHYYDASTTAEFRNRYDENFDGRGLDLSADNANGLRDRTAGAAGELTQQPIPAELSGHVYHDRDDDGLRETGEEGLAGVQLQIIPIDTFAPQSTVTVTTGANGFYRADQLMPGTYRVIEVAQPSGYLDGLDSPGTVNGTVVGVATNPGDEIKNIFLGGGQAGIDYDFGEVRPASIQGRVQLSTPDGDCFNELIEHHPVPGVTIELLDASGNVIATTKTDANGEYSFEGLRPGSYGVHEIQPTGLIDGGVSPGTIDGALAGSISANDTVTSIDLSAGQAAVDVSYCEHEPVTLSGHVYHDRDNDGNREAGEEGIASVTIVLSDENGDVVAETQTDSNGNYRFEELSAGRYTITEIHPVAWTDGLDAAGTVAGKVVGRATNPGDQIDQVLLEWGDVGEEYNFGEFLGAVISGRVQLSTRDGDCFTETIEHAPVVGAVIQLLDENGVLIAETVSDANGEYRFSGLFPGNYSLVEFTPEGLVDGGARAGNVAGNTRGQVVDKGRIRDISLSSGEQGTQFDFCEHVPAKIGGFVYHDRDNDGNRESGEEPIEDVEVILVDDGGNVVARTFTDENGYYEFTDVTPGVYSIAEIQPTGYLDGIDTPGLINGNATGVAENPGDRIQQINIGWGDVGNDFNFGEVRPAILRGIVHTDLGPEPDCVFTPSAGEITLSGVRIQLLDATGTVIAETLTDANGKYEFTNVYPGEYSIREIQPEGYLDGDESAPEGKGDTSGVNIITHIPVASGETIEELNFCELLPAVLRGIVHTDVGSRDCYFDSTSGDELLASVTIQLLNATGDVIAVTTTNQFGAYEFANLVPGEYSIREIQPEGYFDGDESAPEGKGDTSGVNIISRISVGSGEIVENLNFCEDPPATLSGYVFQDGETIVLKDQQALPERIGELRDGQRTDDDTLLSGVAVELRDGLTGLPITRDFVLPGLYADGPILAITDANGFYEFRGLLAGQYSVYQYHPEDFTDGVDTPGTTQGFVFNPGEPVNAAVLASLEVNPQNDAIVRIGLRPGLHSLENNFSEIVVTRENTAVPPPTPPGLPPTPPVPPPVLIIPIDRESPRLPKFVVKDFGQMSTDVAGYTWHLSVVDAGKPRGDGVVAADQKEPIWFTSAYLPAKDAAGRYLVHGQWFFERDANGTPVRKTSFFGIAGAIPVAGDFNGDGVFEVAVFDKGEWFIDINGNGVWDENDLWASLGKNEKKDLPVTGDWDGDGKDDIGIFGPAWAGDTRAIALEPGLPDNENPPTGRKKNVPPSIDEATDGRRVMKLTNKGSLRADVIDHVFHYGIEGDFPVVGDWNGDGIRSIGVFRDGRWHLDSDGNGRWTDADEVTMYGAKGDIPVVGDFNGDGIDEIGFFRDGKFYLDTNGNHKLDKYDRVVELGRAGDFPVAGDFNGDGVDNVAVYRAVENPTESVARSAGTIK